VRSYGHCRSIAGSTRYLPMYPDRSRHGCACPRIVPQMEQAEATARLAFQVAQHPEPCDMTRWQLCGGVVPCDIARCDSPDPLTRNPAARSAILGQPSTIVLLLGSSSVPIVSGTIGTGVEASSGHARSARRLRRQPTTHQARTRPQSGTARTHGRPQHDARRQDRAQRARAGRPNGLQAREDAWGLCRRSVRRHRRT
jgi:hypothetical protein